MSYSTTMLLTWFLVVLNSYLVATAFMYGGGWVYVSSAGVTLWALVWILHFVNR